ncbi:MAG: hypothetical protein ACOYVF_11145 [Candidatus Zixiibacteriota bacterium]
MNAGVELANQNSQPAECSAIFKRGRDHVAKSDGHASTDCLGYLTMVGRDRRNSRLVKIITTMPLETGDNATKFSKAAKKLKNQTENLKLRVKQV